MAARIAMATTPTITNARALNTWVCADVVWQRLSSWAIKILFEKSPVGHTRKFNKTNANWLQQTNC